MTIYVGWTSEQDLEIDFSWYKTDENIILANKNYINDDNNGIYSSGIVIFELYGEVGVVVRDQWVNYGDPANFLAIFGNRNDIQYYINTYCSNLSEEELTELDTLLNNYFN